MNGRAAAAVVVSLERGFQGENLSLWTAGDWGLGHHLQFEELRDEDWLVTFSAATAKSDGTAEDVAFGAASLADLALATDAALVDGVGDQRTTLTEFSMQPLLVDGDGLDVAQPESALLMGTRAVARARRAKRGATHQAATTITRTVTPGHCSGRHAACSRLGSAGGSGSTGGCGGCWSAACLAR